MNKVAKRGLCFVVLGVAISPLGRGDLGQTSFEHRFIDKSDLGVDCKAIGDISGDGFPDIVVADNSGTPLQWYEYPKWTKHTIDSRSVFTTDMQLGDVDADGTLDVIVPDHEARKLLWYKNPGKVEGYWRPVVIGEADRTGLHDVEVGDIDHNGTLDAVIRGHRGPTTLFLQETPSAWKRAILKAADVGEGTALGDIDLDGDLDIVQDGYWLEAPADPGDGNAWLKHTVASGWSNRVAPRVTDVNRDGLPDILLAEAESTGRLIWYEAPLNPREGSWIPHPIDDSVDFVHTLKLADTDNDGDLDIVFAEMQQSKRKRVGIYANQKNGTSWQLQVLANTGAHNVRVGDIGNDGDIDILGANFGLKDQPSPLELWENQASDRKWSLEKWTYIEADDSRSRHPDKKRGDGWWFGLAMGDLTGDAYQDIVSGKWFYRNPGEAMTGKWSRVEMHEKADAMLIVDVDGDLYGDVIAESLPDVFWLEAQDRLGSSWKTHTVGSIPKTGHMNSQGYALAQLVPGGRPEIILAGGDGNYFFEIPANPEKNGWPRTRITAEETGEGIGIGDINGDGYLDIAAGRATEYVAWWENPGAKKQSWTIHKLGSTVFWADRCAVADINGDGRLDVVVTEERYPGPDPDGGIYWFEQPSDPANPNWIRRKIITEYSLNNLDVADLDRDGDPDIVICEHKGPAERLQVLENNGKGSFTVHELDRGKEGHLGARLADLDGDGDLDIVSIAWNDFRYLHVWRNNAVVRAEKAVNPKP